MNDKQIAIVDLSAIYRRYWHASEGEDMSSAKRKTLSFVRSLYSDHSEVIVALDSPPYKRSEVYPEYKANRQPMPAAIADELKNTIENIANDGWKIAKCDGYEADDVIATLVKQYGDVSVYGSDKDLLQCCDLTEPGTGKISTAMSRLGVDRDKVVDYLTLIGDSSDNIKGVNGVGPKTAVRMLAKYGDIKGIYNALRDDTAAFTESTSANLRDAMAWIDTTRQIIQLSDDLDIEIEQRDVERSPETLDEPEIESVTTLATVTPIQPAVVRKIDVNYATSLEPVGIDELWRVSKGLFDSGLYSSFVNAQGAMAAVMHGRELGLGAAASLSSICVVKGRPTLYAETMVALVKASPVCEYIQCTERTAERCTWVTKRRGNPQPTTLSMTYKECAAISPDSKLTQLQRQPATMIMWKCAAAICRMEYPDVTKGIHATEEFQ